MGGNSIKLRKQRRAMWHQDPHCRKCGVLTVLPEDIKDTAILVNGIRKVKIWPDNTATIQHIHSRNNPERGKYEGEGKTLHLLWCTKCNNEDGHNEVLNIDINIRREAAKNGHSKWKTYKN